VFDISVRLPTYAAYRRIPPGLHSSVKSSPAPESFSEPFWQTETHEIITLLVEHLNLLKRKGFCPSFQYAELSGKIPATVSIASARRKGVWR